MKAIITVGISASGKTTWAKEQVHYMNINRDDIRFNTICPNGNWNSYKFSKKNEQRVTEIQEQLAYDSAAMERDIIISDTNLNSKTRNKWISFCQSLGYEVEIKEFPISYEEAVKRDRLRANGVGEQVIYKQYQQWLEYKGRKTYTPNTRKPSAVIFDIDGTLAKMVDRGPFEWDKVDNDIVHEEIAEMLFMMNFRSYYIILLSGRDSVCRKKTEQWLRDEGIKYDELYMRKEGDMRKDAIIKEELFWEHVADRYNVVTVVDDRPQMIRLWHELKIKNVICVGNPYIEF